MGKPKSHIMGAMIEANNISRSNTTCNNFNHSNMYKRSYGFSLPITPSDSYTSNVQPIGSKNCKLETFSWATVPRGWDVFRLLPPPPDNLNRGKLTFNINFT
uniref:Bm9737 n=1 Tax=Brugia malayi TaxID=6279 RepID=A0A0I9N7R7_BRUMA|nr:Bm9737 [Brugia malayi]